MESIMNRSIWTWIQLAASVSNAMFLVISHVPNPVMAGDIARHLVGQAAHHVLVEAPLALGFRRGGAESRL
jgi:hypothetical protein